MPAAESFWQILTSGVGRLNVSEIGVASGRGFFGAGGQAEGVGIIARGEWSQAAGHAQFLAEHQKLHMR